MEHAIERLELGAIKAALRARVQTPLGATEVNALLPFHGRQEALDRIEATRQVRALLDRSEPPPVAGAEDVEQSLVLGEKGVMLESPQLRAIAHTMIAGATLRRHLLAHEQIAPVLYGLAASVQDLTKIAHEVLRCFDREGQLADDASPQLGPLRQRVRALRESIQEKLAELLRAPSMQTYLQENYFTVRADRYVLPIKSSFKNEVRGIVHDASGSGQTVYIEPQVLVDIGNRLKIAQSEQLEEEHRILSELTELVVTEADEVRVLMRVVGKIDLITASGRLAHDLRALPIEPEEAPGFMLIDARHPLLVLQSLMPNREGTPKTAIVANSFGLEPGQQILVVTGPNTGGKTVVMKTVGLFALMVRCGLHLPCREGSRFGWYHAVDVAIGDEQSITANLSTFAAHVKALVGTLRRANPGTLVLIDEIAADTDPTQGQALGQAILERLAERGAHAVVTTHFERLKAVPFIDQRFRNAGVGFDSQRMRPTYHVTLDVPQSSSGFDIAESLGLDSEIVARARALTGDASGALEDLIKQVEQRSGALETARAHAERKAQEAENERIKLLSRQKELSKEIEDVRLRARKELLEEIEKTRAEVRVMVARLQAASEDLQSREVMRAANQAAEQLAKLAKEEASKIEAVAKEAGQLVRPAKEVTVGDWVHVPKLGRDGDVVAIEGRDAHVAVGNIRVRVPVLSLMAPSGPRPKQSARVSPKEMKKAPAEAAPKQMFVEEINLRGSTVDEALDRLEAFLDYHYGTNTTHVRIIHGLGTGALRDGVRDYLKRSGYVKSTRGGGLDEGGEGVTVVELA